MDPRVEAKSSARSAAFEPLLARTHTLHRSTDPAAYDCVKFVVIRDGSAILYSEFGERPGLVQEQVTSNMAS